MGKRLNFRALEAGPTLSGLLLSLALGLVAAFPTFAAEPTPDELAFFETNIRPLLVGSCYECHSAQSGKSRGSLLLDTREALLKGGDSGPAIVPGDPDASLLIRAVRYKNAELQMPPAKNGGPLPQEKVALLEQWVKMGAPDPRTGGAPVALTPTSPEHIAAARREHWAFQPVTAPAIPKVKNTARVLSPVDAFLLLKLEAKGLSYAPEADKRTLLRRLSYDLTGLPPANAELNAFLADKSPDAYARAVERLLASPQYGERWARHWMDVARFADTKGYLAGGEERRFPFSHTYRDYLVKSFNDDKPYDRFLVEQIAADHLELGDDKSALAGMGFLTLGRRFLNREDDIIDDRIDVVMRGTQAITLVCARCHDHKFDPIPIEDYYSMHGIFASSQEPEERPLLGALVDGPEYQDFLKEKAKIEAAIENEVNDEVEKFIANLRAMTGDYLLAVHEAKGLAPEKLDQFAVSRKLTRQVLDRWTRALERPEAKTNTVLAPWFAFAALPEEKFAARAGELAKDSAAGTHASPVNAKVALAFASSAAPKSLNDVAAIYNKFFVELDKTWKTSLADAAKKSEPVPTALADADSEQARQILYADAAPPNLDDELVENLIRRRIRNDTAKYRRQIEALNWTHVGAPVRAMALVDRPSPRDTRVYIRGNPGNPGEVAPRQFLAVLAGPEREPFKQGSGRLQLANAIASKDNPLTPRVIVNRVWGWHFGKPLVSSTSDFGVRTEAPLQLDLLNWLSAQLLADGWSLKALHRHIVMSAAYRQSGVAPAKPAALDPENELIHRFNRRRLGFEETRDTLLAASGRLDLAMGGLPVDFEKEPGSGRRTLYGFIDRQNLPGVYRTFDFANPDASSPGRFATTVPQQALFLMNSPFVLDQARSLAARREIAGAADDADRITAMYRLIFQRAPAPDEVRLAAQFLRAQDAAGAAKLVEGGWRHGYGAVRGDGAAATVEFNEVQRQRDKRYAPGSAYPDEKFQYVAVTQDGGHTGATAEHCSIRRWIAPVDGTVQIRATLAHDGDKGDGVRGRIVTTRAGIVGEWTAFNSRADTAAAALAVKAGDTVDFVTDCRGDHGFDTFIWAPEITLTPAADAPPSRTAWNAAKDFGRKEPPAPAPLDPSARLAQVLLLSNETLFLD